MKRLRAVKNIWLGIFAAHVIALQLMAGAAFFQPSSTAQLDIFGNPICFDAQAAGTPGQHSGHGSLPSCCTIGCSMHAAPLLGDAEGFILPHHPEPDDLRSAKPVSHGLAAKPDYDPGNPRAPPLAA